MSHSLKPALMSPVRSGHGQEHAPAPRRARRQASRPTWRTRDHRMYYIDEMEDRHLLNTIAYLERNAQRIKANHVFRALTWSEWGVDWSEMEADRVDSQDALEWMRTEHPSYQHLVAEAKKRGIGVSEWADWGRGLS